jgi:hypothetical protein
MSTAALREETYLPGSDEQVAQVHNFLEAHENVGRGRPEPRYFLSGSAPGDRVELPAEVYRVLQQVVKALRQGLAVTVAPTTQTAPGFRPVRIGLGGGPGHRQASPTSLGASLQLRLLGRLSDSRPSESDIAGRGGRGPLVQ